MVAEPKTVENNLSETGDQSVAGTALAIKRIPMAKKEAIIPPTTTSLAFFFP